MSDFLGQRVICRRCRYILILDLPAQSASAEGEEWCVEAQCPSCEIWACFTVADTPERQPRRQSREDAKEARRRQKVAERLFAPIRENRSHPAAAYFDRIGNGGFEDDHSETSWPIPCCVYRFRRSREAAYIWQEEGVWYVRAWHPMRGRRRPPEPQEVFTFEAALDQLVG